MLVGYARVSTLEQNLDMQIDALKKAGCEKIYSDKVSGAKSHKPKLEEAEKYLRNGDTLVVWRLDRLGRKTVDLISFVTDLKKRGVEFKSLTESIDTSTAAGNLLFQVMCAFAEMELNLNKERTGPGLAAARARGRVGGRPKGLTENYVKIAPLVKAAYDAKDLPIEEIMKAFKIGSKTTFYKIIRHEKS